MDLAAWLILKAQGCQVWAQASDTTSVAELEVAIDQDLGVQ